MTGTSTDGTGWTNWKVCSECGARAMWWAGHPQHMVSGYYCDFHLAAVVVGPGWRVEPEDHHLRPYRDTSD